jgi:erythromycin esterase-like protein
MAENALWLFNNSLSKNSKMVVWAHNDHIKFSAENPKRFGYHLKEELGHAYYALALTFDEGSVRMIDFTTKPRIYKEYPYEPTSKEDAIEYLFKDCRDSSFFIDFKGLDEIVADKIKEHKYMRGIGANYVPTNIFYKVLVLDSFDGILFFKKTSAAKGLPFKKLN